MKIARKIELIRQQPLEVRMKWVWGCVAASMSIIFAIWIFSIAAMFTSNNNASENYSNYSDSEPLEELKKQYDDLNVQTGQMEELNKQLMEKQGASSNSGSSAGLDPYSQEAAPMSDGYSELQK